MLKIAWLAPCIGVGGGDGFMLHMIRQSVNTQTVGIALEGQHNPKRWSTTPTQYRRSLGSLGNLNTPIYQIEPVEKSRTDGLRVTIPCVNSDHFIYTESLCEAVAKAVEHADVVIEWCFPYLSHVKDVIGDLPIVSLAQNEDQVVRNVTKMNAQHCYGFVGVSKAAVNAFPEDVRGKAQVIYNGIDMNRITPKIGGDILRRSWGIPPESKVLLFHGRLCQEKNPYAVLQAITKLPEEWCGVIVGEGPELGKLWEECARHAIGRIGFVDSAWNSVGDILDAADVFMLASDFEGMPLAVAEAWAAGVPVVASEFTVMKELRQKLGDMAALVSHDPRASSEELAEAVLRVSSEEFKPIVEHARKTAWKKFSISHITAQWELYLEQLVSDYRASMYTPKIRSNVAFGSTFVAPEVN